MRVEIWSELGLDGYNGNPCAAEKLVWEGDVAFLPTPGATISISSRTGWKRKVVTKVEMFYGDPSYAQIFVIPDWHDELPDVRENRRTK